MTFAPGPLRRVVRAVATLAVAGVLSAHLPVTPAPVSAFGDQTAFGVQPTSAGTPTPTDTTTDTTTEGAARALSAFDAADCGPPSTVIPGPPPSLIVVGRPMSTSWLLCYMVRDLEGQTYFFDRAGGGSWRRDRIGLRRSVQAPVPE